MSIHCLIKFSSPRGFIQEIRRKPRLATVRPLGQGELLVLFEYTLQKERSKRQSHSYNHPTGKVKQIPAVKDPTPQQKHPAPVRQ